jgi:NosR/NirI family transcriptional regulator, nitrous oxide reductase regulator
VRLGFLVFTLVWLGWYAQAQLSIVNVLAFLNALRTDFRWEYFLMAPLIFILWFATAAALLFWNRGAFCGWLCPFGALQELLNRAARLVGIPQLRIPFSVHSRLVAIKYIIFLVLFGVSLSALATAEKAAEVEPFKTAIILHFARSWPFLLYVGAILAASLTVERVFCRYLCPLGAALALPRGCAYSTGCGAIANAATLASAAATNARCKPSIPKATSIRTNASSVCTVRCSITTINCAR